MPFRHNLRSTEDETEKLIAKVCSTFVSQLEAKFDEKIERLERKLTDVCQSFKSLTTSVHGNERAILELQEKMDVIDQRQRRNNLRICGVKEADDENIGFVVSEVLSKNLRIPLNVDDIDGAFRIGKEGSDGQPRTILISFLSNSKRNEIFYAKQRLKGSPYVIHEDLTPQRFELLMAAKKKFGNSLVWSSGGKVYLSDQSGKKHLKNLSAI